MIVKSALTERVERVGHLVIYVLIVILGLFAKVLFHGFFELILVHASIGVGIVGGWVVIDFQLMDELWPDLLPEELAVVFGVFEIDSADEFLSLHVAHFFYFLY